MPNTEQKARLIATVRNFRDSDAERESARAELDCLLMEELVQGTAQLSTSMFDAKRTLGDRLSEMTAELKTSSESAARQSSALIYWTKVLVFVTAVYAVSYAVQVGFQVRQTWTVTSAGSLRVPSPTSGQDR